MSFDYNLYIASPISADGISEYLAGCSDGKAFNEAGGWAVQIHGLTLTLREPGYWQMSLCQNVFKFTPGLIIYFDFTDQSIYVHNLRLMFNILDLIRKQYNNQYLLLANGETVVARYIDRILLLNADWDDWGKQEYLDINSPYKVEPIILPLI